MRRLKSFIGYLILTLMFSYCSYGIQKSSYKNICDKNTLTYEDEIEAYDKFLEDYATYINSLNLNDLEIIIKVMIDTLNQIDGYGRADNLISGYYGLSFMLEGKGVCTSFADDFTRKMNKINPKYNARNVVVYVDEDKLNNQTCIPVTMNFATNSNNNKKLIDIISKNLIQEIDTNKIYEYFFGNQL